MSPDPKKITHLRSLAEKLNEVSDSLNDAILSLNATLAEMNLGVAVWPELFLAYEISSCESEDGKESSVEFAYDLGYAKVHGDWQISVRGVTFTREPDGYGNEEVKYINQERPLPLLNAPRAVRLEACAQLDYLIDELSHQAERYIKDVQKASTLLQ